MTPSGSNNGFCFYYKSLNPLDLSLAIASGDTLPLPVSPLVIYRKQLENFIKF